MGWKGRRLDGRDADEVQSGRKLCEIFHIAGDFSGERVFISFQGAESGMALWLNGAYVGYSEDSFTPSEFELTPYLKDRGEQAGGAGI